MLSKAQLAGVIPINITITYLNTGMSLDLNLEESAALWAKAEQQYAPVKSIDRA